jgi:spermidine synthase
MLDWFIPQTVEVITSKFNGEIKIKKISGEYVVWAGGFEQSGFLVEKLWEKALGNLPAGKAGVAMEQCNNALVLGLGCGSILKPLQKKFPKAKIIGIEIDPVMINLGEKYFDLDKVENLKIVCQDAKVFLQKTKQKFDLILVDAYLGEKRVNFNNLKKFLNKNGVILVNKLENLKNETLTIR